MCPAAQHVGVETESNARAKFLFPDIPSGILESTDREPFWQPSNKAPKHLETYEESLPSGDQSVESISEHRIR
ncbi:hypothetical protein PtA15_8A487 [Puccinia triticina]|uniref:Uncharacterized protein n=1 Tax=Puccinia triticina TaxID=208348 RepID=A0ABY7CTA7_9BASI|nr:uncharacterized protein PtA15_8A487 [Puccinia triticina]WAQ87583.1 hypothetical protein PtA15_8A487 [Puccinia triticina]WAR57432.1 hypothetical protein PtB15_8B479 [Puccinia triticina]